MGDIMKKMGYQSPYGFLRLYIFLSAAMTKTTVQGGMTIEAYFFRSFLKMRQLLNFD